MPVKTQCPRCKQPLSVPSKLAGSFANCPRCQGRFWISKDAPLDSSISDSVSLSGTTLTFKQVPAAQSAPAAVPPSASPAPPSPPRAYFPSVTPLAPVATPRPASGCPDPAAAASPPVPPPQARKVARFVSADAAESSLKIAPDGQLPNLQLQDVDKKDKSLGKSRRIPPLVLVAAWLFSVVMTVAIVMFSGNNSDSAALTREKARAMKEIEDQYFGDPSHPGAPGLLPYQRLLREARQARAREDFKAEKQCYRQVLELLRTEARGPGAPGSSSKHLGKGVTGSRADDRELEKKIITILGD